LRLQLGQPSHLSPCDLHVRARAFVEVAHAENSKAEVAHVGLGLFDHLEGVDRDGRAVGDAGEARLGRRVVSRVPEVAGKLVDLRSARAAEASDARTQISRAVPAPLPGRARSDGIPAAGAAG
jgi:hypothetical protein